MRFAAREGTFFPGKGGRNPKKYTCSVCGHLYDPAEGDPENGISQARHLKTFQTSGCARFAGRTRTLLRNQRNSTRWQTRVLL
jgi:rubredoxin